ncbi:DUF2778 domain-containing protein [Paraburkholderia sp. MMS20-SJTR3]|uniref:DUF2778 domain-containing protein n=1 Tax=Paraburkholderia sejongensis TaxID=2886946 RepID=A0ABS8JS44_9BURK|nr:tlde1 domain-containing protein [Paraburkholderia sp. MMS20-SJTR3]MCC8392702.1 DUF2778 domain-containing protein [Paraburkholderia sp. MMS20-SJTR3]
MAWIYGHTSKKLYYNDTLIDQRGYSGNGDGLNNHSMQHVRDVGPIPVGEYEIGAPFRHAHTGPYSMRLTPISGTHTFGRSGFMIHGDSRSDPGNASKGCLVLAGRIREKIWNSGDRVLKVVHP